MSARQRSDAAINVRSQSAFVGFDPFLLSTRTMVNQPVPRTSTVGSGTATTPARRDDGTLSVPHVWRHTDDACSIGKENARTDEQCDDVHRPGVDCASGETLRAGGDGECRQAAHAHAAEGPRGGRGGRRFEGPHEAVRDANQRVRRAGACWDECDPGHDSRREHQVQRNVSGAGQGCNGDDPEGICDREAQCTAADRCDKRDTLARAADRQLSAGTCAQCPNGGVEGCRAVDERNPEGERRADAGRGVTADETTGSSRTRAGATSAADPTARSSGHTHGQRKGAGAAARHRVR